MVLAMGYYDRRIYLGVPGEDLPHVRHYYDEPHPYYRQRVVIVGGKNSAAEAALELYRNGAHVTLVHRGATWATPSSTGSSRISRIASRKGRSPPGSTRGSSRFVPRKWSSAPIDGSFAGWTIPADAVLLLTGYHADPEFLRRAGVEVNPETASRRHDPETFETNVPESVHRRRTAGGQENRDGFHRKRPLSWRAHRQGDCASGVASSALQV